MPQSRPTSPPPEEGPRPILRLEEALVNRIAAGEIIHRPASALKELIENSLDAGSTQIKVTIKDGGLKLLQIQDNGCGIRKSDLPILCERFTTSKLSTFSDLQRLVTYGFRGEALASISHVAHLCIVTKTKDDSCAWKAYYADGSLAPSKPGLATDPKPCAGNDGTTITAEDLFYNTPTRLSSLRSSSDEYARILDIITRYAIHNPHVSFMCKKAGSSSPDISTPSGSTVPASIKLLYGPTIARELLHVTASAEELSLKKKLKGKAKAKGQGEDEADWKAEAYASSANYHSKKFTLLLFINHRSVESTRLKRAIEAAYTAILPKGASPFVYLSLQIDPGQVDVNVHPTKREVHFMNEEKIIETICDAIQRRLANQNESRTFEYQTVLSAGPAGISSSAANGPEPLSLMKKRKNDSLSDDDIIMEDDEAAGDPALEAMDVSEPVPKKKPLPQHKVRTSLADRTLDSMFSVSTASSHAQAGAPSLEPIKGKIRTKDDIKESVCSLDSIQELRDAVVQRTHPGLGDILERHSFVGVVDVKLCLALIQHTTRLYLVRYDHLVEELCYQLGLKQFGNFSQLKLNPPPPIRTLIQLAVDKEGDKVEDSGLNATEAVDTIVKILTDRREMLEEYFSVKINEKGELESLPMLLREYTPNLDRLPLFLMRLGPEVDWTAEAPCFDGFLKELAYLYIPGPFHDGSLDDEQNVADSDDLKAQKWQIQHVLFPAMRKYLNPPKSLSQHVTQVANLPDLYRVFERC